MYSDNWPYELKDSAFTCITDEIYRRLNKYDGDRSLALKIVLDSLERELLISDYDIYENGEIAIKFNKSCVYFTIQINLDDKKDSNVNILRCII